MDGDITDETKGTHWVCYFQKDNEKIYFDSYGIQPPLEMIDYLREKLGDIQYNVEQIQPLNTFICDHICLFVLKELTKGENFQKVISSLKKCL